MSMRAQARTKPTPKLGTLIVMAVIGITIGFATTIILVNSGDDEAPRAGRGSRSAGNRRPSAPSLPDDSSSHNKATNSTPKPVASDGPAEASLFREADRLVNSSMDNYAKVRKKLNEIASKHAGTETGSKAEARIKEIDEAFAKMADAEVEETRKGIADAISKGIDSVVMSQVRRLKARFRGTQWYDNGGDRKITALASLEATSGERSGAPGVLDFGRDRYSVVVWAKTSEGGSLFAVTREGNWSEHCKTLFVENGVVAFDIGWVGQVKGTTVVTDGQWHCIALTGGDEYTIYVDGKREAESRLQSPGDPEGAAIQVGFTNADFPEKQTYFNGQMDELQIYSRRLPGDEIRSLAEKPGADVAGLVRRWSFDGNLNDSISGQQSSSFRGEGKYAEGVSGQCLTLDGATSIRGGSTARP